MTVSDAMLRAIREDAAFTAARVGAPGSLMRQRAEATLALCDEVERLRARDAAWAGSPVYGRVTVLHMLEHQRQDAEGLGGLGRAEVAAAYAGAIAALRAALPHDDPAVRDVFWLEFEGTTEAKR